jgi:hypothetical protein
MRNMKGSESIQCLPFEGLLSLEKHFEARLVTNSMWVRARNRWYTRILDETSEYKIKYRTLDGTSEY